MGRDADDGVYVISVAADLAGVHPQTLRLYERKGLIEPARTFGGSRRYSDRDLDRLHRIGELTSAGVNLEGVRRILELEDEAARLQSDLQHARAEMAEAVERTHRLYRRELVPYKAALVPWPASRRPLSNMGTAVDGGADRRRVS